MLIQVNLKATCTLLDYPTQERFLEEITTREYDIIGISSIIPNAAEPQPKRTFAQARQKGLSRSSLNHCFHLPWYSPLQKRRSSFMMVLYTHHPKENALKAFITKFATSIVATLSCFDRVIFKGYLSYTMQIYVNGHDWLAQQMAKKRIGFCQKDNTFTQLDDPKKAQRLADQFCHLPWIRQLNRWARQVNPVLRQKEFQGSRYYWTTPQVEYSTDIIFRSRSKLARLYERLLDHAVVNFGAKDILTFLGRKLHGNFQGEVLTDCKKKRDPGARIKHRMKDNWLKMYDKFGQVLRIETVINNPREFRVRRLRERNGDRCMVWCPMNKGVANLYQFERVTRTANERYLQALSVVDDPAPSYQQVERLAERKVVAQRSYAGFNPASSHDVQLFEAVLVGDHLLHGFRNQDIRRYFGNDPKDPRLRRSFSARISRLLKRLHVRALIAKIPHTRRWRVTQLGQKLLGAIVQLHYHGLAQAA
jgi:hypothetical protein